MIFIKKILSLPFIVLTIVVAICLFGTQVNLGIKSHFYAISLLLKELIVFILPLIIFSFIFKGILTLKDESIKVIAFLVPLVCLSNFSGFWTSYICTTPVIKAGLVSISKLESKNVLNPAWNFDIVPLIKNDIALIFGLVSGLIGNFVKSEVVVKYADCLNCIANFILKKVICPVLPLFIAGFIFKMQYEGTLALIMQEYSILLLLVAVITYGYMFFVIFFLSHFDIKSSLQKFKNLLPSVMVGLFSMSSAAAIPTTIEASQKNMENKDIAKFVIPATANIHLLGDCFAIPILGLAIMTSYGFEYPTISRYFIFTLYGVVAKFAAAGIPGGSAIIFAPVFESVFGFSSEMIAALTAIYVLFDPIATSSNVFGHGMFAMLFEKVYNKFIRKH